MALNIELLEDELPKDSSEARTILAAVQKELSRLTALTEQYLSIARNRDAKVEPEDLVSLVREAVKFVERDLARRQVRIELRLPDRPVILPLDEMQLRQALFNLIRNADEAMPDGGNITISLAFAERSANEVPLSGESRTVNASRIVRLTVEDEGTGIEPEFAVKVFEPFVSTKVTGTGLGLAVTQQIVVGHGGRIYCESRIEGGARFVLEFPVPLE
jgi:signal transduction histidine kinase